MIFDLENLTAKVFQEAILSKSQLYNIPNEIFKKRIREKEVS